MDIEMIVFWRFVKVEATVAFFAGREFLIKMFSLIC